jgi:hypothetical protein
MSGRLDTLVSRLRPDAVVEEIGSLKTKKNCFIYLAFRFMAHLTSGRAPIRGGVSGVLTRSNFKDYAGDEALNETGCKATLRR